MESYHIEGRRSFHLNHLLSTSRKNTIQRRYRIRDGSGITRKYTAELRRMAQLLQVSLGKGVELLMAKALENGIGYEP